MNKLKSCFIETSKQSLSEFKFQINQYCKEVSTNQGAVFFAVARGKISEGIDFSDKRARAVIMLGIPFTNNQDANVRLKQEYNDMKTSNSRGSFKLTGSEWYKQDAFRALNQCIGRCLRFVIPFCALFSHSLFSTRHKQDYGAVILMGFPYSLYQLAFLL